MGLMRQYAKGGAKLNAKAKAKLLREAVTAVTRTVTRTPSTKRTKTITSAPMDNEPVEPSAALLRSPLVTPRTRTLEERPKGEIAALVEAVDAQQATIEAQAKEIAELKARLAVLERAFDALPLFQLAARSEPVEAVEVEVDAPTLDPDEEKKRAKNAARVRAYRQRMKAKAREE